MTTQEIQEEIARLGPWFYEFDLGVNGRTPSCLPPEVTPIFQTRVEMIDRAIGDYFQHRLPEIRCIDVGCHEGFYSVATSQKGVRQVLGVDVRASNIKKARFIAQALGLRNVTFEEANCEDLRVEDTGQFELCLFLGTLYHLENPMLCLRNISRITSELCVIETQIIDEVEGCTEWGAQQWTRPYQGVLALIDESDEFYDRNAETGASPVAMCPSPKALELMLKQAGFHRTEIVAPPAGAYEQHRRGRRVVCAAYK